MEEKIINIIVDVCDDDTIKENLNIDLIESGLLDSLAFVNLIVMLEDEFNIELQPTQISPENWRTIESIIKLIKKQVKQI